MNRNVKLTITQNFATRKYDWELTNDSLYGLYVCAYNDTGYSTRSNARRAAKRVAQQLWLVIDWEDEV